MKIQTERMLSAADEATTLLKALANLRRLVIVCQLLDKERSVGELAALLKARDSTVSQHLAILRKDGLVAARRDAQTIWYSIASEAAREVVAALYRAYCAPACVPVMPKGVKRAKKAKPARPMRRRNLEPSQ
jgi:DNA-binding transcriptional ArsR family regulator